MGRGKGIKETESPNKKAIALKNLELARSKTRAQQEELEQLRKEKAERLTKEDQSQEKPDDTINDDKENSDEKTKPKKKKPMKKVESDSETDEDDILYLGNQPTAYEIYQEEQRILKVEKEAKKKQRHRKLKNELSELKKLTSELKESLLSKQNTRSKDAFEDRLTDNILKF